MKKLFENWNDYLDNPDAPTPSDAAAEPRLEERTKRLQEMTMAIAPQIVARLIGLKSPAGFVDSEDFAEDVAFQAEGNHLDSLCEWLLEEFGVDTSDVDEEG